LRLLPADVEAAFLEAIVSFAIFSPSDHDQYQFAKMSTHEIIGILAFGYEINNIVKGLQTRFQFVLTAESSPWRYACLTKWYQKVNGFFGYFLPFFRLSTTITGEFIGMDPRLRSCL
jgi:hypothetical protein